MADGAQVNESDCMHFEIDDLDLNCCYSSKTINFMQNFVVFEGH
jgi:hypothetical protein